jgi:hypothetical protein
MPEHWPQMSALPANASYASGSGKLIAVVAEAPNSGPAERQLVSKFQTSPALVSSGKATGKPEPSGTTVAARTMSEAGALKDATKLVGKKLLGDAETAVDIAAFCVKHAVV